MGPMDKMCGDRLQVISLYYAAAATRHSTWQHGEHKMPDTSQYGNYECVRNVLWRSGAGDKEVTNFSNYSIPATDVLQLDFVSPVHMMPKRSTQQATNIFISELLEALQSTSCCMCDRIMALRLVSHHLVLTASQVHTLCDFFRNPKTKRQKSFFISQARAVSKRVTRDQALGYAPVMRSAFQLDIDNPRLEVFTCLFSRCMQPEILCTTEILHDRHLFSFACWKELRHRLGYSRTLDCLHCDEEPPVALPESIAATSGDETMSPPLSPKGSPPLSPKGELRRSRSTGIKTNDVTLSNDAMPSSPTSAGGVSSEGFEERGSLLTRKSKMPIPPGRLGCYYELRLWVHDEWQVAWLLAILGSK